MWVERIKYKLADFMLSVSDLTTHLYSKAVREPGLKFVRSCADMKLHSSKTQKSLFLF